MASAAPAERHSLSEAEILEAMRPQGFDPTATTNGARLQAETLLRLARQARARDPAGTPLFIGHSEWFSAYLKRTGLTAERAPLFIRLAYQHGQDMDVDYRADRVVERVVEGKHPDLALNVRIRWPEKRGGPTQYSYEDALATPPKRMTGASLVPCDIADALATPP